MVNTEYANAYSEVIEILKYISIEEYNKIPKSKIRSFEANANKEYKFKYNPNLTLNEQGVSKRAKAIIAILFRDYWATPIQKEKIIAKQNYDRMQIEKEKQEKYSNDNIFKNKEVNTKTIETNNNSMIKYKQSFFSKILKNIKQIFSK